METSQCIDLLKCFLKHEKIFRLDNMHSFQLFVDWLYPEMQDERYNMMFITPRILGRDVNRLAFILATNPFIIYEHMLALEFNNES